LFYPEDDDIPSIIISLAPYVFPSKPIVYLVSLLNLFQELFLMFIFSLTFYCSWDIELFFFFVCVPFDIFFFFTIEQRTIFVFSEVTDALLSTSR